MRITEAQLRRIVRNLMEAPLAGYEHIRSTSSPGEDYGHDPDEGQLAAGIFGKPAFETKLSRLLTSFPLDVWVFPVSSEFSVRWNHPERTYFLSAKRAAEFVEYKMPGLPEIPAAIRSWRQKTGGAGALIIPYATKSSYMGEVTPWMIFHAMYDSGTEPPLKGKSEKFENLISRILMLLGSSRSKNDERLRLIEGLFTMGSARAGYSSRTGNMDELRHEALTQCLMRDGFRYSREGLLALRASLGDDGKGVADEVEEILQRAEELSPAVKSEFVRRLNGKVALVFLS